MIPTLVARTLPAAMDYAHITNVPSMMTALVTALVSTESAPTHVLMHVVSTRSAQACDIPRFVHAHLGTQALRWCGVALSHRSRRHLNACPMNSALTTPRVLTRAVHPCAVLTTAD